MAKKIISSILAICLIVTFLASGNFIRMDEFKEANQVLATVKSDGITLTITQNELLDYFNSNASSLIQNYGFTLEEAMEYLLEKKVESKYLIIKSFKYLTSEATVSPERLAALYGNGTFNTAESVLTQKERYAAIKSVNEQIQSTIDSFIKEYKDDKLKASIADIDNEKIDHIEIIDGYLKDEYFLNDKIDDNKIQIKIVYDLEKDATVAKEVITYISSSYISTVFDSAKEGEKSLVVSFDELTYDEDNNAIYETHTAEHKYKVKTPRATKTDTTEKEEIEGRYDLDADIKSEDKYVRFSFDHNSDDKATKEAYRKLEQNLKNQNRDIEYFYTTAFESAVISALQFELKKTAVVATDANISTEYDSLIANAKNQYNLLSTDKAKADALNTQIGTNLESLYYYPTLPNIEQFFYVNQILINFSESQKAFLKANQGKDDALNQILFEAIKNELKTTESNPKYDVDYDCPKHEEGDSAALCKHKDEEGGETNCPSISDIAKDVPFSTIYDALQQELTGKTGADAISIFEEYKYKYNDDPGIMNNSTGYLIPPKGVKSSFYESFVKLGRDLYAANPTVGNAFIDGKLAYCFTDYGVHILMINLLPFQGITTAGSFPLDKALNIDGKNFKKVIADQLKAENEQKVYSDFVNVLFSGDNKEIMKNEQVVTVSQKKIDKLLAPYK